MTLFRRRMIRRSAVWLFIALTMLVWLERHSAYADLNDDVDAGAFIEADNADGEEILSRLLLSNDLFMPEVPRQDAKVDWFRACDVVADTFPAPLPVRESRAPPLVSPSV